MTRFQNFGEIYSALYVDFDNIFTRLSEQDPGLARTFATNPQRWMRWLEGHALRMMYGDGVRRRILKRCCYLNPIRYHEFRPFFIRTAFQVVDCPPLTNYGKTSADIHLVMDCMDALAHVTRFDEFIILSGDADFTPLLLRIQEHARRSLVLSVGYTSPAYAAACSWRIREDWFIAQALEELRDEVQDEKSPQAGNGSRGDDGVSRPRSPEYDDPDLPMRSDKVPSVSLPASKRIRLVESIKQLVAESTVPVPLPSVAHVLQSEQEASADWYGAGTLRDLLELLDLSPVAFSSSGQGYVYAPDRHVLPEVGLSRDDFRLKKPELYEFALRIHRLIDLPLLSPANYTGLLTLLVDEICAHGFSRSNTIPQLEDRCEDEELSANAVQINFIVDAIISGGAGLTGGARSAPTLAQVRNALLQRVVELCKLLQFEMDAKDLAMLKQWLHSDDE